MPEDPEVPEVLGAPPATVSLSDPSPRSDAATPPCHSMAVISSYV